VMKDLQTYYKEYNLPPDYVRVYKRILGTVSPIDLQEASDIWMRESEYNFRFPKAGDLIKIIKTLPDRRKQNWYDDIASSPRLSYWRMMSTWHDVLMGDEDEIELYRWPKMFMKDYSEPGYLPPAMTDEEVNQRWDDMVWQPKRPSP